MKFGWHPLLTTSASILFIGGLSGCSSQQGPYAEDGDVAPYGEEDPYATGQSRDAAYTTRRPVSSNPRPWDSDAGSSNARTSYPVAKKVDGKPGRVISPFAPNAGEIDVSKLNSGTQARCPFTGSIFIVP